MHLPVCKKNPEHGLSCVHCEKRFLTASHLKRHSEIHVSFKFNALLLNSISILHVAVYCIINSFTKNFYFIFRKIHVSNASIAALNTENMQDYKCIFQSARKIQNVVYHAITARKDFSLHRILNVTAKYT